ncbi:DsbA family oxidoreductase [Psychrosphaera aestuarii]|uniref:DsbA family oxidoreductase n=1 Tax=Psychrosphaera aestuarii TaxID=1266052 RepID=UPI001B344A1E|nr:DsbA family protein [Psychrosphaera aestuarii]
MIKVEFWLNAFDPYSYIAKLHFDQALAMSPRLKHEVNWIWFADEGTAMSQSISDNVENSGSEFSIFKKLANQFKQSEVWAQLLLEDFSQQATALNRNLHVKDIQPAEPIDYAKIIKMVGSTAQQGKLVNWLFHSYWEKGQSITVESINEEFSLPDYASSDVIQNVQYDQDLTRELGITEAPFMIINEEIGLAGIQPIEHLVEILSMAQSN